MTERFSDRLRAATAPDHAAVDALFGQFALAERAAYGRFLSAHARILPAAEDALRPGDVLTGWTARAPALLADLAALGRTPPPPQALPPFPNAAQRWGALYVMEGSRLGGVMLSRTVAPGLPRAYLSSRHEGGAWQRLLETLDALAQAGGAAWARDATGGAHAMFAAYARAAQGEAAAA